jgi:hypothetical protein
MCGGSRPSSTRYAPGPGVSAPGFLGERGFPVMVAPSDGIVAVPGNQPAAGQPSGWDRTESGLSRFPLNFSKFEF